MHFCVLEITVTASRNNKPMNSRGFAETLTGGAYDAPHTN